MIDEISILDYATGNINSVVKALNKIGFNVNIVSNHKEIKTSKFLIFPGVGHFGRAMETLIKKDLISPLNEYVFEDKKPIIGICLGMQLMTNGSEEGNCEGLNWFDCRLTKIECKDKVRYKVPHVGWNSIEFSHQNKSKIVFNSSDSFYFSHSYEIKVALDEDILTHTVYESQFVSSIIKDNVIGFQFHPEKSHQQGLELIKNSIHYLNNL